MKVDIHFSLADPRPSQSGIPEYKIPFLHFQIPISVCIMLVNRSIVNKNLQ